MAGGKKQQEMVQVGVFPLPKCGCPLTSQNQAVNSLYTIDLSEYVIPLHTPPPGTLDTLK